MLRNFVKPAAEVLKRGVAQGFATRVPPSYGYDAVIAKQQQYLEAKKIVDAHNSEQKGLNAGSPEARDAAYSARVQALISQDIETARREGTTVEKAQVSREAREAEELSKALKIVEEFSKSGLSR